MEAVAIPLTRRETQIVGYIAEGNSNKQIARRLEISEQTIKNHVSSILRKLNANDRAHAVALALRNGWIEGEELTEEEFLARTNPTCDGKVVVIDGQEYTLRLNND